MTSPSRRLLSRSQRRWKKDRDFLGDNRVARGCESIEDSGVTNCEGSVIERKLVDPACCPACVTVNVCPAIVIVPWRPVALVFAETE
jgi:hypothetical protein